MKPVAVLLSCYTLVLACFSGQHTPATHSVVCDPFLLAPLTGSNAMWPQIHAGFRRGVQAGVSAGQPTKLPRLYGPKRDCIAANCQSLEAHALSAIPTGSGDSTNRKPSARRATSRSLARSAWMAWTMSERVTT